MPWPRKWCLERIVPSSLETSSVRKFYLPLHDCNLTCLANDPEFFEAAHMFPYDATYAAEMLRLMPKPIGR